MEALTLLFVVGVVAFVVIKLWRAVGKPYMDLSNQVAVSKRAPVAKVSASKEVRPTVAAQSATTAKQIARELMSQDIANDKMFDAMWKRYEQTGVEVAEIDRAYDELQWAKENPVRVMKIVPESMRVLSLQGIAANQVRIVGSSHWVSRSAESKYLGSEYLLVREPKNKHDANAVAVYGRGRKVGYLSAAKAAALAPLIDPMGFDAFKVGGSVTVGESARPCVDLPTAAALRAFAKGL